MNAENPVEERVREALREVIDPEVGMNVVDLGLIYGIAPETDRIRITMTMTTPACPMGDYLMERVKEATREAVPDMREVEVDLVWDPPWGPAMMSDHAKQHFGWTE